MTTVKRIRRLWWAAMPPHGCFCNVCGAGRD